MPKKTKLLRLIGGFLWIFPIPNSSPLCAHCESQFLCPQTISFDKVLDEFAFYGDVSEIVEIGVVLQLP